MLHGKLYFSNSGADFVQVSGYSFTYESLLRHLAVQEGVSDRLCFRRQVMGGSSHFPQQLVWDVVVCDVVSPQGNLREGVFEKLAHIRLEIPSIAHNLKPS